MEKIRIRFKWALVCSLIYLPINAGETEYRPGGKQFEKAWEGFYVLADHEPEIDDPLIKAGKPMVTQICKAVANKDMKRRRYAISALGYIRDQRAISTLSKILKDSAEIDYFRGDALQAIYQIDKLIGKEYANQFIHSEKYIEMIANAILDNKKWLTEPSEE
jgi:hypothetical protein